MDEYDDVMFDMEAHAALVHRAPITKFKIMQPDLYEGMTSSLPTVLLTFTETKGIYVWYDNLMSEDVNFMCAHVFRHDKSDPILDASFLEFPPIDPLKYHTLKDMKSVVL